MKKCFAYVGAPRFETVTVETFKKAVDEFAHVVLERLDEENILDTNLHVIWRHLERERNDDNGGDFSPHGGDTGVRSRRRETTTRYGDALRTPRH